MGQVLEINMFPMTGARAVGMEEATVLPTGIEGDRQYVAFDPFALEGPDWYDKAAGRRYWAHRRVGQKEQPAFAQITATYTDAGELALSHDRVGEVVVSGEPGRPDLESTYVFEFGDLTPTLDAGDGAGTFLNKVTGAWTSEAIRTAWLGRKTEAWMRETDPRAIMARHVRPLHIISAAAVASLQESGVRRGITGFDGARFRPNLVVDEFGADTEAELVGQVLQIGRLAVLVTDETRRCPVPGHDQLTGENLKDVPQLYPMLPKAAEKPHKPAFGLYGVPLLQSHDGGQVIAVGDNVGLAA